MSILGRQVSKTMVGALAALLVAMGGLLPAMTTAPTKEIVLEARDMAFYLDGNAAPNPAIEVQAGETVRVVLRNRERGMLHDFAVPSVDAATDQLEWNEEDAVTFVAPRQPGNYEYVCRPHLLMMKGTLVVRTGD